MKRLDVSLHRVGYVKEKVYTDIICKLSIIEDFHNLGINDCNAVSLRITCLTFGSYSPERGCHKIFLENWCFSRDYL